MNLILAFRAVFYSTKLLFLAFNAASSTLSAVILSDSSPVFANNSPCLAYKLPIISLFRYTRLVYLKIMLF